MSSRFKLPWDVNALSNGI